jgi:hypothetical protein
VVEEVLEPAEVQTTWILRQIAKLYHLEQQPRDGEAGRELRAVHRASQAAPILARLHRVLCAWKSSDAPSANR